MFSKTKESEAISIPQQPSATAASSTPLSPKRATRSNGVPSIISAEVVVRGTMLSTGDLQVDGRVEGDIRAFALVIGEKSVVAGDVYAEDIVVRGRVEGSICARKVQLCATCHVAGNILHESLSVESGAFFEGNCRHSDNPLADAPDLTGPSRPTAQGYGKGAPAPMARDDGRAAASYAPLKN